VDGPAEGAAGAAARLRRRRDQFSYEDGVRSYDTKKPFEGVITNIDRRYRETESEWAREELGKYFSDVPAKAATATAEAGRCASRSAASTSANLNSR
jgi:excinuclease UvrABC ATPase subunit